jgi:hypothetical protein
VVEGTLDAGQGTVGPGAALMRSRPRRRSFMADIAELQQVLQASRANVLIVGALAPSQRDEIVRAVQGDSGLDLLYPQRHSMLVLPTHGDVIVVLDDVCALSSDDQDRLLKWISRHDGLIVSFASRSPYAMVCAGSFVDRLYYHLNTVCIVLGDE